MCPYIISEKSYRKVGGEPAPRSDRFRRPFAGIVLLHLLMRHLRFDLPQGLAPGPRDEMEDEGDEQGGEDAEDGEGPADVSDNKLWDWDDGDWDDSLSCP